MLQAHAVDPYLLSAGKLALRATHSGNVSPRLKSPDAVPGKKKIHSFPRSHGLRAAQMPRVAGLGDMAGKPLSMIESKQVEDVENVEPNNQDTGAIPTSPLPLRTSVEPIDTVVAAVMDFVLSQCEEVAKVQEAPDVRSPNQNGYEGGFRRVQSDCSDLRSSPIGDDLIVDNPGICRVSSLCDPRDMESLPKSSVLQLVKSPEKLASRKAPSETAPSPPIFENAATKEVSFAPIKQVALPKNHGQACCVIC